MRETWNVLTESSWLILLKDMRTGVSVSNLSRVIVDLISVALVFIFKRLFILLLKINHTYKQIVNKEVIEYFENDTHLVLVEGNRLVQEVIKII